MDITPTLRIRLEPEGQLSSSPPSLICSLIPLCSNMADNTPVGACVLQQQYGLFETMDSTLKGRTGLIGAPIYAWLLWKQKARVM